jgi:hypothetical protein
VTSRPAGPLPNRVTPLGVLVAEPARGLLMGNRGRLHDDARRLTGRGWTTRAWVCCRLELGGRHREGMAPGRYTELFFPDEATALAAGHRPCGECRRHSHRLFVGLWSAVTGDAPRAAAIDARLHRERIPLGAGRPLWRARLDRLPLGTMVEAGGGPCLVADDGLRPWTFGGYGPPLTGPTAAGVRVITPPTAVAVLRAGYPVGLHPSVGATLGQSSTFSSCSTERMIRGSWASSGARLPG